MSNQAVLSWALTLKAGLTEEVGRPRILMAGHLIALILMCTVSHASLDRWWSEVWNCANHVRKQRRNIRLISVLSIRIV